MLVSNFTHNTCKHLHFNGLACKHILTNMHACIVLTETIGFWCLLCLLCLSSGKFMCSFTSHSKSRFRAGRVLANTRNAWQTNGLFPDKCQTLEGVDQFGNRQSKAHSFCFSRKLTPTWAVQESERHDGQFLSCGGGDLGSFLNFRLIWGGEFLICSVS